jgi:hypothetical protein
MVASQIEMKATFPSLAPLKVAPAGNGANMHATISTIPIKVKQRGVARIALDSTSIELFLT